jgi:hypothetical protein
MLHATDEKISSLTIILAYTKIETIAGVDIKIILNNFGFLCSFEDIKLIRLPFHGVLLNGLEAHGPIAIACSSVLSFLCFL